MKRSRFFYSFFLLLILSFEGNLQPLRAYAQNIEDPDLSKEKYFHDLYKNFNSAPTDTNLWTQAKKGKAVKIEISKSDTLWGISEILFGDPNFWPKIWSLNSEKIENPHQIFPQQLLKFTAGSLTQPPALEIEKSDTPEGSPEQQVLAEQHSVPFLPPDDEGPTANTESSGSPSEVAKNENSEDAESADDEGDSAEEEEEIDPKVKELMGLANIPLKPEAPLREDRSLPKSLPTWSFGRRVPRFDVDFKPVSRVPPPPQELLKFFVSKEEIEGVGEFVGSEMGYKTAAEYQFIEIKLNQQESGQKYYAISPKGRVKDPVSGDKAYVYQLEGELTKLEVVNSEDNIFRGIVNKTVLPLQTGSILIPGSPATYKNEISQMTSGKATLIGGEQDTVRRLLHSGSIVFLAGDGLTEGSSYPIYRKNSIRIDKNLEFENPRRIGIVKIIKLSENFATGILVSASEDVRVGDVTDPSMISID